MRRYPVVSRLFHAVVIVGVSLGASACSGALDGPPATNEGLTADGGSEDDTLPNPEEDGGDDTREVDETKAPPSDSGTFVDSGTTTLDTGIALDTGVTKSDTGISSIDTGVFDTGGDVGSDAKKPDALGDVSDAETDGWHPTK